MNGIVGECLLFTQEKSSPYSIAKFILVNIVSWFDFVSLKRPTPFPWNITLNSQSIESFSMRTKSRTLFRSAFHHHNIRLIIFAVQRR